MRKLIFFIGGAGAGKTTLAKALAKRRRPALFDMDTLSRPASEAIMTLSGLDPSDRDSAVYKSRCRDLGYRLTMDAALENVEIGTDAIVIGPFTRETDDPQWLERELARIGGTLDDVEVKVIFVSLHDEQLYHKRISDRGLGLDAWKLENWNEFSRSLVGRTVKWNLPAGSVLYFDNSESISEETISILERFVYGSEAFG
ncbi:AAA family ATPase [Paenibacillus sp. sptzw28]|uniref:AAA family ATPase n=1 Tax=Paenibacillus sp. sptzw28 TaxID=715179 RepID=UPI001C6EDFCC|nr:AAA family ATPase [Paenibacillus sp. sptzw28]QYR21027.1 AAA family ATPase [Paenibacillus sp. sptzw28]